MIAAIVMSPFENAAIAVLVIFAAGFVSGAAAALFVERGRAS